ncbi:murein hydrolase activator EnvC family protein [Solidesulfovibrio sp.]
MNRRVVACLLTVLLCLGAAQALAAKAAAPVASAPRDPKARLTEARAGVAAREAEAVRAARRLEKLEAARDAAGRRLAMLLAALWPLRAAALADGGLGTGDWAEADRRYVWTRSLYAASLSARQAFDAAAAGASQGRAARDEAALRLSAGRKEADAAFSEALASRVQELQGAPDSQTRDGAALLGQALESTVVPGGAAGAGTPDPAGPTVFTPPRGGFSWPAAGKVAAPFSAAGRQPRQGIVLAAPEGSTVAAAAPGRVVFTGALRGYGRVVILAHDARCHTVYACLGEVLVAVGDAVARDAPLGRCGYCSRTNAAGVYFELRFREKALNPAEWLAVRR